MKTTRHVTLVTANLGRGATVDQFEDNVDRIRRAVPKRGSFIGWQEIDEADRPEEMAYIRKVFGPTHRHVGTKTRAPISIPKNFEILRTIIKEGSDGVAHLQPDRFVVQAVVCPKGRPELKAVPTNTHLGRNVPELQDERREQTKVLRQQLNQETLSWLTADLNSDNFEQLGHPEKKLVTARIDYIRAYEAGGVRFRLFDVDTIRLVGDGHNAHVARGHIIWP